MIEFKKSFLSLRNRQCVVIVQSTWACWYGLTWILSEFLSLFAAVSLLWSFYCTCAQHKFDQVDIDLLNYISICLLGRNVTIRIHAVSWKLFPGDSTSVPIYSSILFQIWQFFDLQTFCDKLIYPLYICAIFFECTCTVWCFHRTSKHFVEILFP
jgi:hypothetical protein